MHEQREQNPDFSSITDYFVWDHDAMDALLQEALSMVKNEEWRLAAHSFEKFVGRTVRHAEMEDNILFPLVGDRCPDLDVIQRIAADHRQVAAALELMKRALAARSVSDFEEGYSAMERVLPRHALEEETRVYPAIDRVLSDRERVALVASLVAYKNEVLTTTWTNPLPRRSSFRSRQPRVVN